MSLEKIKSNSLADPEVVNNNFEYLEDKITDTANKIYTNNANFESKISTLSNSIRADLEKIYPVGSIYIGVMDTCPIANLFGTWEKIEEGLCLQSVKGEQVAGTTIEAGLPNITGEIQSIRYADATKNATGVFASSTEGGANLQNYFNNVKNSDMGTLKFNASDSNPIYDNSDTVQPPAYLVNIWKRIK